MAPPLLILAFRAKKGCHQYPFQSIEDAAQWGARKPYCGEPLHVQCFVDRQHAATIFCMGEELGEELREWFNVYFQAAGNA